MSYSIEYSVRAVRELKKINHETANNIINGIERIRIRPYAFVQKVVGTKYYRLKVGKYRVILDIVNNDLVILIICIGHRRNVYKKK